MNEWRTISERAAIGGVGITRLSLESGVSDLVLAREAIQAALTDAGLDLGDVDGLVTYVVDPNGPMELARALGLRDLNWFSVLPYGGTSAGAAIQDAVLAVGSGQAEVVVGYRAANMRSEIRYGQPLGQLIDIPFRWVLPWGMATAAHALAPWFHRYMHEFGLTNADLAPVALTARHYASTNPNARFFETSFGLEDYQASKWVAEPVLRVADCCLETDGGAAFVVARADRLPGASAPVGVSAAARGMAWRSSMAQNYYRDSITELPDAKVVAAKLWEQSGLQPRDISAAILYDAFSPVVLLCLEAFGFCKAGEAAAFVADGQIDLAGDLPVNTNGGQLAEGYLHGFNGIVESVRQIRGTAVNQVPDVEHMVVTGGLFAPGSAAILSRLDR